MRRGRQGEGRGGEGNGKGMGIAKNIPLFALPKDEGYQTRARHKKWIDHGEEETNINVLHEYERTLCN